MVKMYVYLCVYLHFIWLSYIEMVQGIKCICHRRYGPTYFTIMSAYHLPTQGGRASHYADVIMHAMASQITSLTIVCSTGYSGEDERKHQSSASLAFVRGIHRWPVNSLHKGSVKRKMCPFYDFITGSHDIGFTCLQMYSKLQRVTVKLPILWLRI